MTGNPNDSQEIAEKLDDMLSHPVQRDLYSRNSQRRVYDRFLVFTQVQGWLRRLVELVDKPLSKG